MSDNLKDMALDALLAARSNAAPELPIELIQQVYSIERSHQFEESREVPLKSIQKLIEDLVTTDGPK